MRKEPKAILGRTEDGRTFITTSFALDDPPYWRVHFTDEDVGKDSHIFETEQECSEFIHRYHEENVWR